MAAQSNHPSKEWLDTPGAKMVEAATPNLPLGQVRGRLPEPLSQKLSLPKWLRFHFSFLRFLFLFVVLRIFFFVLLFPSIPSVCCRDT